MAGRVLVIRGGAIGDFILTLPVLRALRKTYSSAHLSILGYPKIACLAVESGLADEIRPLESAEFAPFFVEGSDLPSSAAGFLRQFGLIVSYLYDPDRVFERNVHTCSQATFVRGLHRPDESENVHATEVLLRPLQQIGISDADNTPRLSFGDSGTGNHHPIVMHPGSGSPQKNWPEEKWIDLLRLVAEKIENPVVLIGGEAESNRLQRLASAIKSEKISLLFDRPLPEVARAINSAAAFVGHDSGISHLAAALDRKCIVLWGPTKETIWRPLGRDINLLRAKNQLHNLNAETVLGKLKDLLSRP